MAKKVSQEVLAVLAAAVTEGNGLKLSGQLDRTLYEATDKVIKAAGGKWNRKAAAHVFPALACDAIDQIVLSGEVTDLKQEFQAFFSPAEVVLRLVEAARLKLGDTVLEPSAGEGVIVKGVLAAGIRFVDACEIQPELADKLALIEGVARLTRGDFLQVAAEPIYDKIVMNPPFTRGQDVKHVRHALRFLRPGGRLVSVMSTGIEFRQDRLYADFRELIQGTRGTIERLPDAAFKASGTNVSTVMVSLSAS